jgi:hypothetical protein
MNDRNAAQPAPENPPEEKAAGANEKLWVALLDGAPPPAARCLVWLPEMRLELRRQGIKAAGHPGDFQRRRGHDGGRNGGPEVLKVRAQALGGAGERFEFSYQCASAHAVTFAFRPRVSGTTG